MRRKGVERKDGGGRMLPAPSPRRALSRFAANLKIPPTVSFLPVSKCVRFFSFLGTGLIEGEEERDLASLGH